MLKYAPEAHGRLASDYCSRFKAHLLALEVALEGVEEEAVVRDGEPGRRDELVVRTGREETDQ